MSPVWIISQIKKLWEESLKKKRKKRKDAFSTGSLFQNFLNCCFQLTFVKNFDFWSRTTDATSKELSGLITNSWTKVQVQFSVPSTYFKRRSIRWCLSPSSNNMMLESTEFFIWWDPRLKFQPLRMIQPPSNLRKIDDCDWTARKRVQQTVWHFFIHAVR